MRHLFAIALLALLSVCSFAQQSVPPTPPFLQCPAVGADTSCAILIEIDTFGSLRVHIDPSQGPFDTIEDTLIGVQNNSTKTILSIPLSSGAPIFGFDGDGVCGNSPVTGVPYVPAPIGCPFGPTSYEGQTSTGGTVSFAIATPYSGVVNFPGGLPGGQSAYFSLEGAIQTQCPPINAPSRLAQDDLTWGGDTLDHLTGPPPTTLAEMGCYIASAAMMINYHAARQGSTFRTNPRLLNNYLTGDAIGFDGTGGSANPFEIAGYARRNGVSLFFVNFVDHRDDFTLDQYLCNGQPPLLMVGNPHWVLPTGQTTVNGIDTYADIDPDDYPNGSTLQGFSYTYSFLDLYTDIVGPLAGLYVAAHSPVELLLTAPNGAQTGFNPVTNTEFDEIPSSGYGQRFLANDQNHALPPSPAIKNLIVVGPTTGAYTLQATGTGSGAYTLDLFAYDSFGAASTLSVAGNIIPGVTATYTLNYSSTPGSTMTVVQVVTIADLTAAVSAAAQNGLIDNGGITNSLLQKLQAASAALARGDQDSASNVLNAFINEVSAQSGKHIQIPAATVLITDAQLLVQQL